MSNTVRLHRVLRATPERVYRAFLDPDAMAKWLPPNGFTGKVHHLDATRRRHVQDVVHQLQHRQQPFVRRRVPRAGAARTHALHRQVRRPEPAGRDAASRSSLKQVSCGTELTIVQEGIPDVIPLEACYLGWQESLVLLAQLVEAEIPDGA